VWPNPPSTIRQDCRIGRAQRAPSDGEGRGLGLGMARVHPTLSAIHLPTQTNIGARFGTIEVRRTDGFSARHRSRQPLRTLAIVLALPTPEASLLPA